jgi:uncharacterized membrane protein
MTTTQIVIIVAVLAIVALLAAVGTGGPRVTQIDRTVRHEKDGDDA